ncbi:MAG: hypothetical protein M1822_003117 [Bathelium mastoideum]|nr:MAG: hypothetical protein M1822_003117 [Bathelium mastoideum]
MEEEADLPELPHDQRPLKRSRMSHDDSNTSSDPIFSSDGPEPSADDYDVFERTNKRQYRGTWWQNSRQPRRIGISRKIDSGIYMASSEMEDSLEDTREEFLPGDQEDEDVERINDVLFQDPTDSNTNEFLFRSSQLVVPSSQQLPANEEHARRTILRCAENNISTIDLSSLALESLPDHLLAPIQQIIKMPHAADRAPDPESYHSFAPALKLILSGNRLRSVPPLICNFEHLTVLSLRGNKLTELPHAIGKLQNLVELNVAYNRLRWLPYELLNLLAEGKKLKQFTWLPNSFVEALPRCTEPRYFTGQFFAPRSKRAQELLNYLLEQVKDLGGVDQDWFDWMAQLMEQHGLQFAARVQRGETDTSIVEPIRVAKSRVTFFNLDGSLASKSVPSPRTFTSRIPASPAWINASPPKCDGSSFVPSLFESALRACRASPFFREIQGLLPADVPESVLRGLQAAAEIPDPSGNTCTVCGRRYVMKRTEWIEYWFFKRPADTSGRWMLHFTPFLRQGCSWKCVG